LVSGLFRLFGIGGWCDCLCDDLEVYVALGTLALGCNLGNMFSLLGDHFDCDLGFRELLLQFCALFDELIDESNELLAARASFLGVRGSIEGLDLRLKIVNALLTPHLERSQLHVIVDLHLQEIVQMLPYRGSYFVHHLQQH
jgi:hypothetical protein